MILHGDSLEKLRTLDDCSVDAVVTDPPYGLGNTSPKIVAECLRAWSCGETWEPSGRGFMNKSWDAWVPPPELWREVLRVLKPGGHALVFASSRTQDLMSISLRLAGFEVRDTLMWFYGSGFPKSHDVSKGIDKQRDDRNDARQWEGWGTALKPAYEPVILIRKPLDGTVANNVLEHSTGAINIDACRVGDEARVNPRARNKVGGTSLGLSERGMPQDAQASACTGRWPANVILDDHVAEMLDDQVQSNVSRFFYCPKASKTERDAGLEGRKKQLTGSIFTAGGSMKTGSGNERTTTRANTHPTVKPLDLMRYLVRLITPPNGLILDPFTGSGSTLCAGALEGFRVIGIEREAEYVEIARARLAHWTHEAEGEETMIGDQLGLFDT